MARSYANALTNLGYETTIGIMGEPGFEATLQTLFSPDLDLVFCLGSIPLSISANGRYLWEIIPRSVRFITVVVDALPYDFRIVGFAEFIANYNQFENCSLVCYEKNIADVLRDMTQRKTFYMPTGANPMPRQRTKKNFPDRLMFWGSIGAELSKHEYTGDIAETLAYNNIWGFSPNQIQFIAENLMFNNEGYGLKVFADIIGQPLSDMIQKGWIKELCEIDSSMKRFRRFFLIHSLKNFPIDLYGKNWEPYASDWSDIRICSASPDHNEAFGQICQHYGGVVNIDPNWGWGTNERVITALALGTKSITSTNRRVDNIGWCFQYDFTEASILGAAERLLNSRETTGAVPEASWEYLISSLLYEMEQR